MGITFHHSCAFRPEHFLVPRRSIHHEKYTGCRTRDGSYQGAPQGRDCVRGRRKHPPCAVNHRLSVIPKGGVLSLGSVTASAVDFVAPSSAGIGEFNVQCAAVNLSAVTAIHDLGEIGTPVPIGNPLEQSINGERRAYR